MLKDYISDIMIFWCYGGREILNSGGLIILASLFFTIICTVAYFLAGVMFIFYRPIN